MSRFLNKKRNNWKTSSHHIIMFLAEANPTGNKKWRVVNFWCKKSNKQMRTNNNSNKKRFCTILYTVNKVCVSNPSYFFIGKINLYVAVGWRLSFFRRLNLCKIKFFPFYLEHRYLYFSIMIFVLQLHNVAVIE